METSETVLWESWGPAGEETCSDCVSVGGVAMKGQDARVSREVSEAVKSVVGTSQV